MTMNVEVLLDDRKERPGVMLKDIELIGIPHIIIIIIGDKKLSRGQFEYTNRRSGDTEAVAMEIVLEHIKTKLSKVYTPVIFYIFIGK
ncbi:hypothetical protein GCM10009409_36830 [Shewanella saliphila]|uniref:Anticodon-binding domain-containing protein n=1 Tax=Shewanella saliphila TaxID=2282698 RepID=A0ABQ2QCG6_9GAMM|nr:hypothetical protein GCM10009409_36830 [Shewanella saliphila]